MIYIQTTPEKFKKAKLALLAHGGKLEEKTEFSGTVTLKMVMSSIVAAYEYRQSEAVFDIRKLPFFLTDKQVGEYLKKLLS